MQTILVFTSGTMSLPRKIAGIQRFARQRNWNVQQIAAPATSAKVRRLIDFWRPAGCIVEASGGLKLGPKPFGGVPVVFLDQDPAIVAGDAPLVRHDPAAIATLAAKELMPIARHYAFIDWFTPVYWAADKRAVFREILDLHGHPCHIFTPHPSDQTRPLAFQKRLRQWVARLPAPCGIFAVNDSLGAAVIAAAAACGRAIPDDISVVGVDDDEAVCENTHPTMSSILPDFEGTGYRTAELLSKLIDNSHPPLGQSNLCRPCAWCAANPRVFSPKRMPRWPRPSSTSVSMSLRAFARAMSQSFSPVRDGWPRYVSAE